MRTRLLLDPAAEPGGGGSTTPAPAPTATQPPAQQAASPAPSLAPPPTVHEAKISLPDLQKLYRESHELVELRTRMQQEHEAAEQVRLTEMAKRGEAEEALKRQKELSDAKEAEWRKRYEDLRNSLHAEKMTAVVADALAGAKFVSPAAARHAREMILRELETSTDAQNGIIVRQKGTGRPAADFIADALSSPDYAHYQEPSTRGGGGSPGGARSAPSPAPERAQTPAERQKAALQAALGRASGGAPGLNGLYGRPVTTNN